jgi:hypothetical protein
MTSQPKTSSTRKFSKILRPVALLLLAGLCSGCSAFQSHSVYTIDPYVSKKLAADIDALCDFTVIGADGKPQLIRAKVHLRAGEYVKALRSATAPTTKQ